MKTPRWMSALPVLLLLGAGCASAPPPVRDTVVLLPETAGRAGAVVVSVSEGKTTVEKVRPAAPGGPARAAARRASGVVTVTTPSGTVVLDEPYETADVNAGGGISTRTMDESESSRRFGGVLAAQPPRPISRTLYFVEGTDALTPESEPALAEVKSIMAAWPAPQVSVIGHTDRVGSEEKNDKLGLQRAEMVKRALVGIGVDAAKIDVVSRGEREPLVPTGDEVPEPRNRRVEINVR